MSNPIPPGYQFGQGPTDPYQQYIQRKVNNAAAYPEQFKNADGTSSPAFRPDFSPTANAPGPGISNANAMQLGAFNGTVGLGDVLGHQYSHGAGEYNDLIKNQNSLLAGNTMPYQQGLAQLDILQNGVKSVASDPTAYMMGGNADYARQQANALQDQSMSLASRTAPTLNTGAVNMINGQAGNMLGNANATDLTTMNAAGNLMNTANGAGYQGQLSSAQGLQNLAGQIGTGPSAAEMAMRQSNEQGLAGQAALAASARGGNTALALRNAAANAGTMNAATTNQVGIQRANEVAVNNAQKMQALGAANQGFGAAAGTQQGAFQGAGGLTNAVAGNQLGQANTNANIAGQYADLAKAQGTLQLGQTNANDAAMLQSQQLANQYMAQQLQGTQNFDQNRTQNQANILTNQYANRNRTGEGTITGSGGGDKALEAGVTAVGTGLAMMSDVRAKKGLKGAVENISDAFRQANSDADTIRGTSAVMPMSTYAPARTVQMGLATSNPYSGAQYTPSSPVVANGLARQNPYLESDVRRKKDIRSGQGPIDQVFEQDTIRPEIINPYRQGVPTASYGTTVVDPWANAPARPDYAYGVTPHQVVAGGRDTASAIRQPMIVYPNTSNSSEFPDAPGYAYQYKVPSEVGASPGTHYGPMAQDLEKTPAGASVVGTKNGRKFVDTGRLTMLNTSEVSKQRKELDVLQNQVAAIQGTNVPYPTTYGFGG